MLILHSNDWRFGDLWNIWTPCIEITKISPGSRVALKASPSPFKRAPRCPAMPSLSWSRSTAAELLAAWPWCSKDFWGVILGMGQNLWFPTWYYHIRKSLGENNPSTSHFRGVCQGFDSEPYEWANELLKDKNQVVAKLSKRTRASWDHWSCSIDEHGRSSFFHVY